MLAKERQIKILENLQENQFVKVNELSKLLNFTEETIRRDLEKLENENQLKRTHGGAIPINTKDKDDDEIPFNDRQILNQEAKMEVAQKAVQLVHKGDVIFLDASSTAHYLSKLIPDIEVTILTNSILVSVELAKKKAVKVILTGGNVSESSLSLVGPTAIRSIEHFHVHKVFMSCKGFDHEWGISDSNEQQANVKRRMIQNSEQVILLIDSTKIGQKSFVNIDDKRILDYVVIDSEADKEVVEQMLAKHTKLIY